MAQQYPSKVLVPSLLFVNLMLFSACETKCDFEEPVVVSGGLANLVDKSLLTQEPCTPPCWYGIVPGITLNTEAVDILEDLDFIAPGSIDLWKDSQGGTISWQTVFPEDPAVTTGIVFGRDGTVSRVNVPRLWYNITLQQLIDAIGLPDGIITRPYGLSNFSVDCTRIDVVWFDNGLEVSVALAPISKADQASSLVKPDLLINGATYFPSVSSLDEYITIRGDDSNPDNFVIWDGAN